MRRGQQSRGSFSALGGGDGEEVDGAFLDDGDDKTILTDVRMGKREESRVTGERPASRARQSRAEANALERSGGCRNRSESQEEVTLKDTQLGHWAQGWSLSLDDSLGALAAKGSKETGSAVG